VIQPRRTWRERFRRVAGDRSGEAKTLDDIGDVYDSLGEKQKAFDFHNQAAEVSARSRPF
jgi:Flp pilus assembly protein TadD